MITLEKFGLLVKLSPNVRAMCPTMHLGDVTVKNPETKFVGQSSCDAPSATRTIMLACVASSAMSWIIVTLDVV